MEVTDKNKKVLIWAYELDPDLIRCLKKENVTVVALLGGVADDVPSFSIYDLFYRTAKLPFDEGVSKPIHLSDAFMYRYLDCVSRVSFVPLTDEYNTFDIGIVGADNVADWGQFHAQTIYQLLTHFAPDEVWFFRKPHLGIDNLVKEVGRQSGLPVLTFYYSMMAGKFFYETSDDKDDKPTLEFIKPPKGEFESNLFYMKQKDKMRPHKRMADRFGFFIKAPFKLLLKGQRRQTMIRLYIAAQRRQFAALLCLLDCFCKRTRENAFKRFVRRSQFRADLKKRPMCDEHDLQKPFIYFPLHFQPEESTSAPGDFFTNQINAIEAIRDILPVGWWICVKENPIQRYMYRDSPFYKRVKQCSDVKFIADSASSKDLISKSRIVASIAGTVGYEALLLGKSCIYFGPAWYRGLPNAFEFRETLDLAEVSSLEIDSHELHEAMRTKMGLAGDGVVYPWAQGYYEHEVDWPQLMKTTAKSLVRISQSVPDSG